MIFVEFHSPSVGRELRLKYTYLQSKFYGRQVTPIGKHESNYNIQKKFGTSSSKATAINFPLKLSWSVTSHKVQGQTIYKPKAVVLDFKKANFCGQAHVMLSRSESLDQLYILDDLFFTKWKVSSDALKEIEKMETSAINLKSKFEPNTLNLLSLNIRSLRANFDYFSKIHDITSFDVICLQETWLEREQNNEFSINGFNHHLYNAVPYRGIGIATFYKNQFNLECFVSYSKFQITKIVSNIFDILNIYYKNKNEQEFVSILQNIVTSSKPTIICGDFNINYLQDKITKL